VEKNIKAKTAYSMHVSYVTKRFGVQFADDQVKFHIAFRIVFHL